MADPVNVLFLVARLVGAGAILAAMFGSFTAYTLAAYTFVLIYGVRLYQRIGVRPVLPVAGPTPVFELPVSIPSKTRSRRAGCTCLPFYRRLIPLPLGQ